MPASLEAAQLAYAAELSRLRPEILKDAVAHAVMHMADQVFDAYEAEMKQVRAQRDRAYAVERERTAELRAENARLRAELDVAGRRNVLLCPAGAMLDAMEASRDEEPGTILRATDMERLEYELGKDRQWHRR
jgi:hypothetical protein